MNLCRMKGCCGLGSLVMINETLEMRLCPLHSIELKEFGFRVDDLTGNQPWLHSINSLEPISQADGTAACE